MKNLLFLVFTLFTSSLLYSQTLKHKITPANNYDIAYEVWELDNGLTIIVHEDNSDPMVHVEVTYHVGSNREQIGITGFAHFFEHMMFQGSDFIFAQYSIYDVHKFIKASGYSMNTPFLVSSGRHNHFKIDSLHAASVSTIIVKEDTYDVTEFFLGLPLRSFT